MHFLHTHNRKWLVSSQPSAAPALVGSTGRRVSASHAISSPVFTSMRTFFPSTIFLPTLLTSPAAVTGCTCEWWIGASICVICPLSPSCRGFTCFVFTFTSFTTTRPVLRNTCGGACERAEHEEAASRRSRPAQASALAARHSAPQAPREWQRLRGGGAGTRDAPP